MVIFDNMKITINTDKTYTQTAYANKHNRKQSSVARSVKRGTLKTIQINGATLIVEDS